MAESQFKNLHVHTYLFDSPTYHIQSNFLYQGIKHFQLVVIRGIRK